MFSDDDKHVSPEKKKLIDLLRTQGPLLPENVRKMCEDAIQEIDDTNPADVAKLLPQAVLPFYHHTFKRCQALPPLITHSMSNGCYIESIILSHGLIELCLRGLYVFAWQRAIMPKALTDKDLMPYFKQYSKQGKVHNLVKILDDNGLLYPEHAKLIENINEYRNRAAHGVIFGEIELPELKGKAESAQAASCGALEKLNAWFNNPIPLKNYQNES